MYSMATRNMTQMKSESLADYLAKIFAREGQRGIGAAKAEAIG